MFAYKYIDKPITFSIFTMDTFISDNKGKGIEIDRRITHTFDVISSYDALVNHSDELTSAQLDYHIKKEPWTAFYYCPALLTKKQFDFCVTQEPGLALTFYFNLLSKEQIIYCAEKEPKIALKYAPELFIDCVGTS